MEAEQNQDMASENSITNKEMKDVDGAMGNPLCKLAKSCVLCLHTKNLLAFFEKEV